MKNRNTRRTPEEKTAEAVDWTNAGSSRPPLARMMRLHERLMAGRYPNCRKMANEFEVSPKTIQRDVNFMRDQMGLPIEYDKGRFGFRYTRPVDGFPAAGHSTAKAGPNPWRQLSPPPIGERPVLGPAGRGSIAVRIGFDVESARLVHSRAWHPTQVIRPLPGGALEMTLRIRDESEIVRWVLCWGGHAWIVEPPRLCASVREISREILDRHETHFASDETAPRVTQGTRPKKTPRPRPGSKTPVSPPAPT